MIVELCGKIQKFYPSRWEKVAKNGGKMTTMATNFQSFLSEIDDILKDSPNTRLSPKWAKRVAEYREVFQEKIQGHL